MSILHSILIVILIILFFVYCIHYYILKVLVNEQRKRIKALEYDIKVWRDYSSDLGDRLLKMRQQTPEYQQAISNAANRDSVLNQSIFNQRG